MVSSIKKSSKPKLSSKKTSKPKLASKKVNISPKELQYRKKGSVQITFPHMRIYASVDDSDILPHYDWDYIHEAEWDKSSGCWRYYFSDADENFKAHTIAELVKELKTFISYDDNVKSVGVAEIK